MLVNTETSMKDGFDFIEKRFFTHSEGNILYNFNYGKLAPDLKIATLTLLRAIETIPNLLEKYQKDTERISKDISILQEVIGDTWKKEGQPQQAVAQSPLVQCAQIEQLREP